MTPGGASGGVSPLPMRLTLLLTRVLALALALSTGGVVQAACAVAGVHVTCADEAPGEDEGAGACTDCHLACTTCLCCPGRVALGAVRLELRPLARVREPVVAVAQVPVVGPRGSDIFRPPRA